MFKRVLVANRGEIAVRVIKTLSEMGIESVVVYSDADKYSLHTLIGDIKYNIGPPPPEKSYLNIEKIISIAKLSDSEAIHPGYGFLSQNPLFAKRCEEEGIVFIGPGERIQRVTGNKLGAKKIMKENNVPVIPGALDPVKSLEEALDIADKIGYPIMVKPVLGGGGIGMRICHNEDDLKNYFKICQKLALSSFGSLELYIEKFFPNAKHIEVQILADNRGKVIHLFERECSLQRRFQKVMEEAPSPSITEDLREKITSTAVRAAKAINYWNAGTVEFIYIPSMDKFYFLEVNSRIQVEHPITEMITGIDIVEEQIKIAYGENIDFSQNDIKIRGHAIEARINAEDPFNNFMPSPGLIKSYFPPFGFGIRLENGVYSGYIVPPYYDPLIAKLIVWGENRDKCIRRIRRALQEYVIRGIKTNIPLQYTILNEKRFIDASYTTRFLEEENIIGRIKYSIKLNLPEKEEKRVEVERYRLDLWKLSGRILQTR